MAENPEDLNLPTAVVKRIVSDAVPPTCKVSKEANAAIAKAASVFVLYATSCANNVAQKSHWKTLTGADFIKAIHEMEFDKFVKPLEASLESWKVRNSYAYVSLPSFMHLLGRHRKLRTIGSIGLPEQGTF